MSAMVVKTDQRVEKQQGSIIVMVLLILAIMTVIGIMSADTTITENYIIRNVGISKQNLNLVESAAMESYQEIMLLDDDDSRQQLKLANAGTGNNDDVSLWLNDVIDWNAGNKDDDWHDLAPGRVLDTDVNHSVPGSVQDGHIGLVDAVRGENEANIRVALVADWDTDFPDDEVAPRKARLVVEYVSEDAGGNSNGYGRTRLELGIEKILHEDVLIR